MVVNEYKSVFSNNNPQLKAVKEYPVDGRKVISDNETVADIAVNVIGLAENTDEYVYVLCLDTKNHLIGLFEASHGGWSASPIDIKSIFQKTLLIGASGMILIHNHPSGDPEPSKDDNNITDKIKSAAEMLTIRFLDHVIIGSEKDDMLVSYYSYNAKTYGGVLKRPPVSKTPVTKKNSRGETR